MRRSQMTTGGTAAHLAKNLDMYLLVLPGLLFLFVFFLLPLGGTVIAFKDYNIFSGKDPIDAMIHSPWVGFRHFQELFSDLEFFRVLGNTLLLSIYKIVFLFPVPILLSFLLNEVRRSSYKRTIQTLLYIPHFVSWPVIYGFFFTILSANGIVNSAIAALGGERVLFFMDNRYFRSVLVFSEAWKEAGWGTIIYLAAISGIDPQLYEAAVMDGLGRFRQALYITLPGIASAIVVLLILRIGSLMEAGFDQVLAMYNPTVYATGDIIQTYVYRIGIGQLRFSYGTAFGLFNSAIAIILIFSANRLSKALVGRSIW